MKKFAAPRRSAFTLLEMLTVIAVTSVLMVVSVPAIGSLVRGSTMNQALGEVSGYLDQARQYAISHDTYVWVAFRPTSDAQFGDSLSVALLASKTGTDASHWSGYGAVPDAQIDLIARPRTFRGIRLRDAGTFGVEQIPGLIGKAQVTSNNGPGALVSFSIRVGSSATAVDFTKVIQFTPSGAVRVTSSDIDVIELDFQPTSGTVADSHNVAVLRVNGLTGQTALYRP